MEIKNLPEDINVLYVKAESFPLGIKAAHEKIHSIVNEEDKRRYFGISWMNKNNEIEYLAAAEALNPNESDKYGCSTFTIRKGDYISETLLDWCKPEGRVAAVFQEMLKHPQLDKNGYCLEIYLNDTDMECLVKLQDKQ